MAFDESHYNAKPKTDLDREIARERRRKIKAYQDSQREICLCHCHLNVVCKCLKSYEHCNPS